MDYSVLTLEMVGVLLFMIAEEDPSINFISLICAKIIHFHVTFIHGTDARVDDLMRLKGSSAVLYFSFLCCRCVFFVGLGLSLLM